MTLRSLSRVLLDSTTEGGGGTLSTDQQKIASALSKVAVPEKPEGTQIQPKVVKNVIKEPPQKALEGEFTDDPALNTDAGTVVIEDTTRSNIHGDDKTKTTVVTDKTKIEPPKKVEEKKEDKTTTVKVATPAARDYNGFSTEEQSVLKQMSNPAFEFTAKALRDLHTLQQQKPDHYLQHKDAFVLLPEFQEASRDVRVAAFEEEHWKEQLLAIRSGRPWRGLQGFDEKGNPVYSGPYKPTDEAEIEVNNAMNYSSTMAGQLRSKLVEIQNGFKSRIDQDNAAIQAELRNRFGWVEKPELQEEKVNITGIGDVPIKQIITDFRSLFAKHHQNNPILEVAAHMFVALQIYGAKIRELTGQVSTEQKLKSDITRAEPSATGGTGGKTEGGFVFDGSPE